MRVLCQIKDSRAAANFSGYLVLQGIENEVERDDSGGYAVWIRSDDDLEKAVAHLERFQREPGHRDFQGTVEAAAKVIEREQARAEAKAARTFSRRNIWSVGTPYLTVALMVASIGVAALSGLGSNKEPVAPLFISESLMPLSVSWTDRLPELREGQVWRLITPIFLHFGAMHIMFNMMALLQLGTMIERVCGTRFLAVQVFVLAVSSNLGQFILHGPAFGGMSGVLYGLFGFIWIKGRYDSGSSLGLPHQTVAMMLIWFIICFSGYLPIANTAHTVGLVVGAAWGYLSARRSRHFTG